MNKLILPIIVIIVIAAGIGAYFVFQKPAIPETPTGKCGDGICDDFEKANPSVCPEDCKAVTQPTTPEPPTNKCGDGICDDFETANPNACPKDCQKTTTSTTTTPTTPTESSVSDDFSFDADGFLWGTEGTGQSQATINAINNIFKTKYVKFRIYSDFCTKDWKSFTKNCGIPRLEKPMDNFNLDGVADIFAKNGWSMMPMLSYSMSDQTGTPLKSQSDVNNYANFVMWFLQNYKEKANIKYLELENAPVEYDNVMLLKAQNKIYDAVKEKYPDVLVGTPGFEYFPDDDYSPRFTVNAVATVNYFLDKNNGAKFDFWAFHGYPLMDMTSAPFIVFPPTQKPKRNKYAGVYGILEIRKRMDANGWQDRLIIDTEHSTMSAPGSPMTEEVNKLDAAYIVQELLLKKTLRLGGKPVLAGAVPFKTAPRKSVGEFMWGNLNSDGSPALPAKAVALLWLKLNEYNYDSHISGEFDNENQAWIEKFKSGNKELYIFFKPFKYISGQSIAFDNETIKYTLNLNKKPTSVALTDINGNKVNLTPSQSIKLEAVNSPKFLEVEY